MTSVPARLGNVDADATDARRSLGYDRVDFVAVREREMRGNGLPRSESWPDLHG